MAVGYGVGKLLNLDNSYWILMTISIVMQSDYVSTRAKAMSRAVGTVIGLTGAYIILSFSPPNWFMLLILAFVVPAFFSFIKSNYSIAVIGITLFVIFEFQVLAHAGLDAITPRFWDTLIACSIALIANIVLWPQWSTNRLRMQLKTTLSSFESLLGTLLESYSGNKSISLDIVDAQRVAAYQCQHELINRYQQALREPFHREEYLELVKSVRQSTHTFLNHATNLAVLAKQKTTLPTALIKEFKQNKDIVFEACYQQIEGKELSGPHALVDSSTLEQIKLCEPSQKQVAHQLIATIQILAQIFDSLNIINEHHNRRNITQSS